MKKQSLDPKRYETRTEKHGRKRLVVWAKCKWCDKVIYDAHKVLRLGAAIPEGPAKMMTLIVLGSAMAFSADNHERRCTSRTAN